MKPTNTQPLKTVTGEELMSEPIRPPNFIVDSLFSQGLHILAGAPKVGKSWLALWLAVTVAKETGRLPKRKRPTRTRAAIRPTPKTLTPNTAIFSKPF